MTTLHMFYEQEIATNPKFTWLRSIDSFHGDQPVIREALLEAGGLLVVNVEQDLNEKEVLNRTFIGASNYYLPADLSSNLKVKLTEFFKSNPGNYQGLILDLDGSGDYSCRLYHNDKYVIGFTTQVDFAYDVTAEQTAGFFIYEVATNKYLPEFDLPMLVDQIQ